VLYRGAMVLLSQAIRTAAITGSTDSLFSRIAGRQGGRWAERTVRAAVPTSASPGDPAGTLRELTRLRQRGVITDEELHLLRTRLRV
jgi:hypothetical protein